MNEQEKTNFTARISDTLKILSPRSQEIVLRRFGLKIGNPETLESIGKRHKVTRERVRQIEETALRELRKNFDGFNLGDFVAGVKGILASHGNAIKEDLLFNEFSGSSAYNKVNASLVLLLNISSLFEREPENQEFHTIWTIKDPFYIQRAKDYIGKMVQAFRKNNSVVFDAELANFFNKLAWEDTVDKKALLSYAGLSKLISRNIFGQWGLVSWPEISPKGIKDKAYLVLKKTQKPVHFREIAGLINGSGFDSKRANVQTVHNELIKDKRFVLVGRGLYALSEWGYENGTVKDVLARLLRKHGPMERDKIVAKTAEIRFVKPNTIVLNLQDKKLFQKDERGFYRLAKRA